MQLHQLKPTTKRKSAKRIGLGGKRGKTSGRGGKGQTARTGNSMRPEMRDFIKKIPKLRGHGVNRAATVNADKVLPTIINVGALEAFEAGASVTPKTIVAAGIIRSRRGKAPEIKILGTGTLTKSLAVSGCLLSESAKAKIEAAGGTVA
jgi:large subunit ribosomal protein L15